jgi:signal transduction histidine kinase
VVIDIDLSKVSDGGKDFFRVTIEDHGPGIPDVVKSKLFSRLERGKTKASGRGLGLYLVRTLVEEFAGKVWVEDRVSGDYRKGARFTVLLPASGA